MVEEKPLPIRGAKIELRPLFALCVPGTTSGSARLGLMDATDVAGVDTSQRSAQTRMLEQEWEHGRTTRGNARNCEHFRPSPEETQLRPHTNSNNTLTMRKLFGNLKARRKGINQENFDAISKFRDEIFIKVGRM